MTYSEIHVWGDSLARGIIYSEEKGRYAISPERCTSRLQRALGIRVENHSNMGATILDGLKSFAHFTPVPDALCVIEFGGNDCDLNWAYVAEHPQEAITPKVPLIVYRQKLAEFAMLVRRRGMKPLFVTPLPLHARRYFDWVTRGLKRENVLEALGDVEHIYRWQERYSVAVRGVAQALNCALLDMRDIFLSQPNYEQLMCIDGIHPNDKGHRVIADAVLQKVSKGVALEHEPEEAPQEELNHAL